MRIHTQRIQMPVGVQVDVDHLVPIVRAGVGKRRKLAQHARITDQYIELAKALGQLFCQRFDHGGLCKVKRNKRCLPAVFADGIIGFLKQFLITRYQHHMRALGGKTFGHCRADTALMRR